MLRDFRGTGASEISLLGDEGRQRDVFFLGCIADHFDGRDQHPDLTSHVVPRLVLPRVPKQFGDHGFTDVGCMQPVREGMAQVVDMQVAKFGSLPRRLPGRVVHRLDRSGSLRSSFLVCRGGPRLPGPSEDEFVVIAALLFDDFARSSVQDQELLARTPFTYSFETMNSDANSSFANHIHRRFATTWSGRLY